MKPNRMWATVLVLLLVPLLIGAAVLCAVACGSDS